MANVFRWPRRVSMTRISSEPIAPPVQRRFKTISSISSPSIGVRHTHPWTNQQRRSRSRAPFFSETTGRAQQPVNQCQVPGRNCQRHAKRVTPRNWKNDVPQLEKPWRRKDLAGRPTRCFSNNTCGARMEGGARTCVRKKCHNLVLKAEPSMPASHRIDPASKKG